MQAISYNYVRRQVSFFLRRKLKNFHALTILHTKFVWDFSSWKTVLYTRNTLSCCNISSTFLIFRWIRKKKKVTTNISRTVDGKWSFMMKNSCYFFLYLHQVCLLFHEIKSRYIPIQIWHLQLNFVLVKDHSNDIKLLFINMQL